MDFEQVANWLDAVYSNGDLFELVAIKDGKARRKTFTYGGRQHTYGGIATVEVCDAIQVFEEKGFDVYASALPLQMQAKGLYDRLWVDQDDLQGPWPWGTDPDLQWPKPTTMVKTSEEGGSHRWQAIWLLNENLSEEDGRRYMRSLAKQIGADMKVHDPRRILRVPGVMNAKRGMMARFMGGDTGLVSTDAFKLPKETAVQAMLEAQVQNPTAILGEWLAGFGEGERNQKAYICARFLRSCDVVHDDALAIVAVGARRCQPSMDEQEVFNAVWSAYHAG